MFSLFRSEKGLGEAGSHFAPAWTFFRNHLRRFLSGRHAISLPLWISHFMKSHFGSSAADARYSPRLANSWDTLFVMLSRHEGGGEQHSEQCLEGGRNSR